jgi:hypothetical protein
MDFNTVESKMNSVQFFLRTRVFGRLQVRRGLPKVNSQAYLENEHEFYKKAVLKSCSSNTQNKIAVVADIGCRNWSYAGALADLFPHAELVGIEVDGGRRYWNLYRRMDYALAYAHDLNLRGRNAKCIFKSFTELSDNFLDPTSIISGSNILYTLFFPFVSERPCLKWGLPRSYANFKGILQHAFELAEKYQLMPLILSVHQGEWEAEIARAVYQDLQIKAEEKVLLPSETKKFWPSPYASHLFFTK